MFKTGLVSISFRKNTAKEIIKAMGRADLSYIEWGSDVHAPYADAATVAAISDATCTAGLSAYSYGSYYRIGVTPLCEFSKYLESAKSLGASLIRVWAYNRFIPECEGEEWDIAVEHARAVAKEAEQYGIKVCLECHPDTITEDYNAALKYLRDVSHENLRMYWQPNQHKSIEYNIEAARALAPYTEVIHVFNWDSKAMYPLRLGKDIWHKYLLEFDTVCRERIIPLLLEFMPDHRIESLDEESLALREISSVFD
jgi:sugar phosphate isomerase/epimerase